MKGKESNHPLKSERDGAYLTHGMGEMEKTMHEFKEGSLHSGSEAGPVVRSRKQAVAIGMSQQRKAGRKGKR